MPEYMKDENSDAVKILTLVSRIDWKAMAIALTALTGALGFAWNKVELYFQDDQQQQLKLEQAYDSKVAQQATGGAYEALATRLDELFSRIEVLEKKARVKPSYEVPPAPLGQPVMFGRGGGGSLELRSLEQPKTDELAPQKFQKARLPDFQAVQKAAEMDIQTNPAKI